MTDPRSEYQRQAVAVMTAYFESDDDVSMLCAELVAEALGDGEEATADLLAGFVNLSASLVVMLERATGRTASSVLQEVAARP